MINFSTGLRNNLVNSSGLGSLMNSCAIYVYSGTIPSTPDNAPNGTWLATITTEGRTYTSNENIPCSTSLLFLLIEQNISVGSSLLLRTVQ